MVRAGALERIPPNASFDISNGLLDRQGGQFKRGGTSFRTTAFGASGLRFIWDGWLVHNGQQTIVATPSTFGRQTEGTITSIGGSGMASPGRPAVYEGKLYLPGGNTWDGETMASATKSSAYYAVVANRLLVVEGSKIPFSVIGDPTKYEATDFHEIPGGIEVTGLVGLRSSAAVFTTGGIWIIGNLNRELTDEAGNVQQTLDLYSQNLVLWGDAGIASWEGALVVPTLEGVYLLSLGVTSEKPDSFVPVSAPIVDLYRSYVRSGYTVGQATVADNRYYLPILAAGDVIDTLVCHLDMPIRGGGRAWTRLQGYGAKMGALTTRITAGASRTPELLGAQYGTDSRVLNLLYSEPSANVTNDANGSKIAWSWTTRSYATGNLVRNLISKVRLRYQLVGPESPKIDMRANAESDVPPAGAATWGAFAWGDGSAWATPGAESFEPLPASEAPPSIDGAVPHVWRPNKKRRFARFRFTSTASTSQLSIHSVEIFVRPDGRL